jgi:hypothetical protein
MSTPRRHRKKENPVTTMTNASDLLAKARQRLEREQGALRDVETKVEDIEMQLAVEEDPCGEGFATLTAAHASAIAQRDVLARRVDSAEAAVRVAEEHVRDVQRAADQAELQKIEAEIGEADAAITQSALGYRVRLASRCAEQRARVERALALDVKLGNFLRRDRSYWGAVGSGGELRAAWVHPQVQAAAFRAEQEARVRAAG